MKKILIAVTVAAAMVVGGCSTFDKLRDVGQAVTATITNPIDRQEIARLESIYEVALVGAVSYRRYCYSRPLAELPQAVCGSRRAIIRALQASDSKAKAAIQTAKKFVAENPTISAVSVVAAARQAVTDFLALANANAT